jgi:general stress protein YciG
MSDNSNPGNFANRAQEEVQAAAQKGGQSSHNSGFASMDADKQRDIASQGGQASSGSFEKGSEKAKEVSFSPSLPIRCQRRCCSDDAPGWSQGRTVVLG